MTLIYTGPCPPYGLSVLSRLSVNVKHSTVISTHDCETLHIVVLLFVQPVVGASQLRYQPHVIASHFQHGISHLTQVGFIRPSPCEATVVPTFVCSLKIWVAQKLVLVLFLGRIPSMCRLSY